MQRFFLQLINGLQVGSIYALVALGYSMVYGIVKLINFAHGEVLMVGAYVSWYMISQINVPIWIAVPLTILLCSLLGVTIERVAYKPLRKAPRISLLITAIGVSFLLQNGAQLIFTATPRTYTDFIKGNIALGALQISMDTIITIAVTVVLMVLLTFFIGNTRAGKSMRAVSEDTEAAQLMGVNVNKTISLTFAIGSALAAVAAILYCCAYPSVKPTMSAVLGLKAFVAAVIGGIGSIPGAMVGGLLIGIAETFTKGYISSTYADAIVFALLIVMLLVRPSGLMGIKTAEKV